MSKSRDYEALCREIGPQQGWPYEDLINRHKEQQDWERVLAWAEDGLGKLLAESGCRLSLQEARGEALIHLGRSAEALDELQALFQKQRWEARRSISSCARRRRLSVSGRHCICN